MTKHPWILLVAACACGGGRTESSSGGEVGGGPGGGRGGPPAVEVARAAPRTVAVTRAITGTLAPGREARLVAQLEGTVTRVRVAEGDRVRAGAALAEIDATIPLAELAAARTRARTAQANAARTTRLLALGAASRTEQEEAAAVYREAQGQLRAAEERVSWATLRAPFDGVVTAVRVDQGDVVGARQDVVVVADLRDLRVEVPVSELDLVRLTEGDPVEATVDAIPGRTWRATVRRIYPTVDPATRQGVIEVALAGAGSELRPGLLARLTITVEREEDVLAIPLEAVRRDVEDREYAYVVREASVKAPVREGEDQRQACAQARPPRRERGGGRGRPQGGDSSGGGDRKAPKDSVSCRIEVAERTTVRVGVRGSDNWVQVLQGVKPGDRVIVSGDQELGDGARVRLAPPPEQQQQQRRAQAPAGGARE